VSKRPPAPPPVLAGYTVTRLLGSGGFADVYLYRQALPHRDVAIKVLIPGAADAGTLAQFNAEANLMAALSTHPAIVTIYHAGIAADGRPYLVMEYCSRPNLSVRYRSERLSVAEVLRIGVRIAGAVETAHRAGILHRDIKPANVLTTDFGHPVLSDFGISVSRSGGPDRPGAAAGPAPAGPAAVGMSVPWTAPELFVGATLGDGLPGGDERSDIYSLAATLYTALARRSPFDRPGGPNGTADLIGRIRSAPLPPLGRSDAPESLQRVLARAMDRNPAARQAFALDLARDLQRVEAELDLAPTPVDVLAEQAPAAAAESPGGQATRIRAITVVDPVPSTRVGPVPGGPDWPEPGGPGQGWLGGGAGVPGAGAAARGPLRTGPDPGPAAEVDTARQGDNAAGRRSLLPLLLGGGALLVIVVLIVGLILIRGDKTPTPPNDGGDHLTTVHSPGDPLGSGVPAPANLAGVRAADGVRFSWTNPDPRPGDTFQWYRTDAAGTSRRHVVTGTTVTVSASGSVCIAVILVRGDGASSPEPARACGDAAGPSGSAAPRTT